MLEMGVALGAIGLFICLLDWRKGIFVMAFAGIVQDPVRKLVPEEPIYLTLIVGIFFAATILGRAISPGRFPIAPILRRYRGLALPIKIFMMLFAVNLVWTLLKYKSVPLAGIAVIAYLVPIAAVALGYNVSISHKSPLPHLQKYCTWYALLVTLAASGIAFDYFGFSSPLFEQVGKGIVITDFGESFRAYSGFFRSPEIAGWHIGAAICMFLILVLIVKGRIAKVAIALAVLFLFGCAMLTGRRKVVMLVVIFLGIFTTLVFTSRLRIKPVVSMMLLAFTVGPGLLIGDFFDLSAPDEQANIYYRRTGTVFADAGERFQLLGLGSIGWALVRNGIWGVGAGVASSGAQYFGGGVEEVGGSAEGGLGKITAEFGLPGLLVTLWIMAALSREGWRTIKEASRYPVAGRTLEYGLLSFLAANVPVFMVASPAYGDLFVILTLGIFMGVAAGLPERIAKPLAPGAPAFSPAGSPKAQPRQIPTGPYGRPSRTR